LAMADLPKVCVNIILIITKWLCYFMY
jgi:hypothetical protein